MGLDTAAHLYDFDGVFAHTGARPWPNEMLHAMQIAPLWDVHDAPSMGHDRHQDSHCTSLHFQRDRGIELFLNGGWSLA